MESEGPSRSNMLPLNPRQLEAKLSRLTSLLPPPPPPPPDQLLALGCGPKARPPATCHQKRTHPPPRESLCLRIRQILTRQGHISRRNRLRPPTWPNIVRQHREWARPLVPLGMFHDRHPILLAPLAACQPLLRQGPRRVGPRREGYLPVATRTANH
jgi:hypothetical protein